MTSHHEQFMRPAIELAVAAGKRGDHPFGAVLVRDGKIIETADNTVNTGKGTYGHAEYNLVMKSVDRFTDDELQQCTLYTSTAPCMRCFASIVAAGIPRVVYSVYYDAFARVIPEAMVIPDWQGAARLLGVRIEMEGPVLEEEGLKAYRFWSGQIRPLP